MSEETRSLAQTAYEAYCDFTGYVSRWEELPDSVRGAWGMAAEAVIREVHENDILPETLTGEVYDAEQDDAAKYSEAVAEAYSDEKGDKDGRG